MNRQMARERVAYFEALLQPSAGTNLTPGWRAFYESQIEDYRSLIDDGVDVVGNGVTDPAGAAGGVGDSGAAGADRGPEPAWRATNERAWARVMDALGVAWQYEALEPDLSRAIRYQPDFWLPNVAPAGVWLEIKSTRLTPGEQRVARQLREATGCRVYAAWGWPRRAWYGVAIFSEAGDVETTHPDYTALVMCQLFETNFSGLWAAMESVK